MGIETLFFISLAVIFLLLVALVYHFHTKFTTLDQRVNNVIEIINSVVKEMQNLKTGLQGIQQDNKCCFPSMPPLNPYFSATECINIPADSFIQTSNISLGNVPTENIEVHHNIIDANDANDANDDEDDDDNESSDDEDSDDDDEQSKIVVSDDEEEIEDIVLEYDDILDIPVSENELQQNNYAPENSQKQTKDDLDTSISIISNTDYKKMDISQLRAIAGSKGIDAKKMKKAELVKLFEK